MQESTVTAKGQTTLPKDIRAALGLQPGDRLRYLVLDDGQVRLLKSKPARDLSGLLFRPDQPALTVEQMAQAVRAGQADPDA